MTRLTEDQFAQLVREHHAAVYRSARRFVGDAAAAADVAQEVFLRALRGKVRSLGAEHERSSLCWLAAKLGQNAVRARHRQKQHEEKYHTENVMSSAARELDPAVVAADNDLNGAVQQCLCELPNDLQLPLEMHLQDDLTLAAIGSTLRLSTSTVHERVQRGLARLRQALTGRGYAVGLGALPQVVQSVAPPSVPPGLEAQLLGISTGSSVVAVDSVRRLVVAGFATVLVACVAVSLNWLADSEQPRPTPEAAVAATTVMATEVDFDQPARVPVEIERGGERNTPIVIGSPPLPGQDPVPAYGKTFVGSVHDGAHWPVVGARVAVIAAGGFKPFELGRATTDVNGHFKIQVSGEMTSLRPAAVRLAVSEGGVRLLLTDELAVPRKDPNGSFDLVLPVTAGVATERYECRVSVQDESGTALLGAKLTLFSGRSPMAGALRGTREAVAQTGSGGAANLRGRKLGSKWLFVDGRAMGYGYSLTKVALESAGQHDETIKLSKAGSLLVLATTVAGKSPSYSQAYLFDEQTAAYVYGQDDPKGGTRFTGLGTRRYSLYVNGGRQYSPTMVRDVAASQNPVTVRLKLRQDERDVGDHLGEVHGTVIDAATGKEIALPDLATEVLSLRQCDSTSLFDGLVPPPPVQVEVSNRKVVGFHEVGIEPGRYGLLVDVRGYARAVHEFTITDREMHTGVRIELHRGVTVTGKVLDAAGQPVAGATVFPIGVGVGADDRLARWRDYRDQDYLTAAEPNMPPCMARSNENGEFVLSRVPPGIALRLVARKQGMIGVGPLGTSNTGDEVVAADLRLSDMPLKR